jgi:hypothetical protein
MTAKFFFGFRSRSLSWLLLSTPAAALGAAPVVPFCSAKMGTFQSALDKWGPCGVISELERQSLDIVAIPARSPEAREFVCH